MESTKKATRKTIDDIHANHSTRKKYPAENRRDIL